MNTLPPRLRLAADLRLVAELVEDGVPAPIAIRPHADGIKVQVSADDVPDWLLLLDLPLPEWTHTTDGDLLDIPGTYLGSPITLVAFRPTEVTC